MGKNYYKKKGGLTKSQKSQVTKMIKGSAEQKFLSRPLTTDFSALDTTADALSITGLITQGDGYNQRIGDRLFMKDMTFKGLLEIGASDTTNIIRICCIAHDPDWDPSSISITTAISPKTSTTIHKVYFDKYHYVSANDATMRLVYGKAKINRKVYYEPTDVIAKNSVISLVMVSDSVADDPGFQNGHIFVNYYDL